MSRAEAPRIASYRADAPEDDLLGAFPGRFAVRVATDRAGLESLLLAQPIDLVLMDCRGRFPPQDVVTLASRDPLVDCLAVGMPPDRRSVPNGLRARWCPWPLDRTSFYRLVTALAQRARFERELRRLQARETKLETEARLGRTLATTLHELGNPLDAVRRLVRLARDEQDDPTRRDGWLRDAELGLDRMAGAIGSLHAEARRSGHDLQLATLRDVLRDAAVISGVVGGGIDIETHVAAPDDVRVPRAVTTALTHLLTNARRAVRERGSVRIDAERDAESVRIAVSDDGEGFAELFKDELFRPYFSTRGEDGLGLGLPEAQRLVEALGGRLEAESPGLGLGATFTIVLPCPRDATAKEQQLNEATE